MAVALSDAVFSWFKERKKRQAQARSVSAADLLATDDEHELMRLGDLCAKRMEIERATAAYHRAAQIYEGKGHFQKVVAMRKRIVELVPLDPTARMALAESLWAIGRKQEANIQSNVATDLSSGLPRPVRSV